MGNFGIAFSDGNFGFVIKTSQREHGHDHGQNLFNGHQPPQHLNDHHGQMFNGPQSHHFNGHHDQQRFDRHNDHGRFDRHQVNNNYDNSCGCENQGDDENFDFDNSDLERLFNGGLNNNKCQQNSQQNNLEDRLNRLENMIKNNQQPENQENSLEDRLDRLENIIKGKQPEKQENNLENRLNKLEDSIRPKREENDFAPNTNKDKQDFEAKLKELENSIAKKKDEKAFEARMNQLKEDQKEAARRGFIGTPDKPEKKDVPALEIKHEVKYKPVKKAHHHKEVKKIVYKETSIHAPKPGDIQNYMLGSVKIESANLKYEPLFANNKANCHKASTNKPLFNPPMDTIKCH